MDTNLIKTIAPVVVIVIVLALRFRSMSKERPLNPGTLWVLPVILVGLAAFMLATSPLSAIGLSIGAVALVVGGLIGWQRGKLIHILRDPATGKLTQRASPAAMILLIAIIGLRYVLRAYFDATPGADGKLSEQALIITDALLLFAVGLIAMTRVEMALRARKLVGDRSVSTL
ncbi:MAG: hypothetical protein ABIN83_02655 [Sphingomicrobium sp.]